MRNNQRRLGQPKSPQPSSPGAMAPNLAFAVPTEFVELPSQGKFYPEDHPLHLQETVEIKFMTAKDEDILSSRSLIKKGVVIDRLLSNILVNKQINLDDLLVGDKNALIIAARITGYGEQYDTNVSCPVCGLASQFSFNLADTEINQGGADEIDEVTETDKGTFKFSLPKTKVDIEVRLLNGHDEKKLQHLAEKRKKYDLGETTFTDQLRTVIISVNGNSEMMTLTSFIENMPALDSRYFRNILRQITPNIDMTQIFACQNCGHSGEMEVPFTADFFWPQR